MKNRHGRSLALVVLLALGACAPGPEAADPTIPSPMAPSDPSPTPTVQDVMELENFAPLEPGTYFIDPDADPSTPLRVVYEVPAEGWSMWIGAIKSADDGHVGVSITTVMNLVRDGCRDHSPADPPVGPSVDDLATALAGLAPFRVKSPPRGVAIYGYRGKHLELTVPDLPRGPGRRPPLRSMRRRQPQELDRPHPLGPRRLRVLWLQRGAGPHRGVLDPRHRGYPSDDRGELVARFAAEGCCRDARHPGLHTDRAMRLLETVKTSLVEVG